MRLISLADLIVPVSALMETRQPGSGPWMTVHGQFRGDNEDRMNNIVKYTAKKIAPECTLLRSLIRRTIQSVRRGGIKRAVHFLVHGHLIRSVKITNWTKSQAFLCLQIGGGKHVREEAVWINGDLIEGDIYLNASKRLPFRSNSLDLVFTEQFLEHLTQEEGTHFLREAYRVLKNGGVLRQSTPDLQGIVDVYMDQNKYADRDAVVERHLTNHRKRSRAAYRNECQFVNDMFRLWGHQFIYDEQTLEMATRGAGFSEIKKVQFGKPGFNEFTAGLERHADYEWMKHAFVMIFEAKK